MAVKAKGFLLNRGTENFSGRIVSVAGVVRASDRIELDGLYSGVTANVRDAVKAVRLPQMWRKVCDCTTAFFEDVFSSIESQVRNMRGTCSPVKKAVTFIEEAIDYVSNLVSDYV